LVELGAGEPQLTEQIVLLSLGVADDRSTFGAHGADMNATSELHIRNNIPHIVRRLPEITGANYGLAF